MEIMKHVGEENFKFIATTEMDADRVSMGFENMNETKSFVIRAYESEESYTQAEKCAIESDVAIMGSSPLYFTQLRMAQNKLTFQYSERLLKNGYKGLLNLGFLKGMYLRFVKYRRKKQYVMCASAYTALDLQYVGFTRKKCIKWGYFPQTEMPEISKVETHNGVSILWAGRLIEWKHPLHALYVAKYLKNSKIDFTMNVVGEGPEESVLKQYIIDNDLDNEVKILGAKRHSDLMNYMASSDIFLFTSDKREGWGAVLNEAMTNGCAVVANSKIGSAPFLVSNNRNGMLYNGSVCKLCRITEQLATNSSIRNHLSENAKISMNSIWNVEFATQRLIQLFQNLLHDKIEYPSDGPCSLA